MLLKITAGHILEFIKFVVIDHTNIDLIINEMNKKFYLIKYFSLIIQLRIVFPVRLENRSIIKRHDRQRRLTFTGFCVLDYAKEVKHGVQSRHMEKNLELGPAKDAVEVYGPDIVTYELCKADFEKW